MKRILVWAAVGLASIGVAGCGGCGGKRLNGAGSSFVYPMMTKWAKAYQQEKKIEVNYQSKGSSAGIEMMTDKSVDFGATDAPMNDKQLDKARKAGGEVIHIPLVMGGVVPAYNLPGIKKPLNFTGPVLSKIYLRIIKKWKHPELERLNQGVDLPDKPIRVIHRSDGSGTTYIWTDYLQKATRKLKLGKGKWTRQGTAIEWPKKTVGAKGTEGVAGEVSRNEYSIGYIELTYALQNKIQYGRVQNRAGKFLIANLDSVTEAAKNALKDIPEDLRFSIVDAKGKGSYPISGTTWAVIYVNQSANKQGRNLVDFLKWVTHEGQDSAKDLQYARLPETLVKKITEKLDAVKLK
jgi:phosphate transport system substrate-binding protein